MRLAPFLLLLAALVACGSPASVPDRAPSAADAADVQEISFEISALM